MDPLKKRSEVKKKNRKRVRNIFFVFAFVLFAGITYAGYQYYSGGLLADDAFANKDKDPNFQEFEGVDPQFGEINVLLIGSDARADEEARSDALMIGHFDQTTNAVKLVSLMRDTYVEIPDHGKQKINAAFTIGGPELVRKTIKENFDIDVQYYAIVDFKGFSKIVDVIAPEGIAVNIPYTMSHGIGMTLKPGEQLLNGEQLLGYVRFRHDINSDFGRVERQQEALSKLKEQAISVHTLLNLPKLVGVVEPYIDTNVDNRTILSIGKGMLIGGKSKGLETLRIPVEGSFSDKRVDVGAVLDIDLEKNKEAIRDFLTPREKINSLDNIDSERTESEKDSK